MTASRRRRAERGLASVERAPPRSLHPYMAAAARSGVMAISRRAWHAWRPRDRRALAFAEAVWAVGAEVPATLGCWAASQTARPGTPSYLPLDLDTRRRQPSPLRPQSALAALAALAYLARPRPGGGHCTAADLPDPVWLGPRPSAYAVDAPSTPRRRPASARTPFLRVAVVAGRRRGALGLVGPGRGGGRVFAAH